jgi:hypothetical protein
MPKKIKYYCPVCSTRTNSDTEFLLYKAPNNVPDICCVYCFDEMMSSHRKIIQNLRSRGNFVKKLHREKNQAEIEQKLLDRLTSGLDDKTEWKEII